NGGATARGLRQRTRGGLPPPEKHHGEGVTDRNRSGNLSTRWSREASLAGQSASARQGRPRAPSLRTVASPTRSCASDPKQPQSSERPRAHACPCAATKTTINPQPSK